MHCHACVYIIVMSHSFQSFQFRVKLVWNFVVVVLLMIKVVNPSYIGDLDVSDMADEDMDTPPTSVSVSAVSLKLPPFWPADAEVGLPRWKHNLPARVSRLRRPASTTLSLP